MIILKNRIINFFSIIQQKTIIVFVQLVFLIKITFAFFKMSLCDFINARTLLRPVRSIAHRQADKNRTIKSHTIHICAIFQQNYFDKLLQNEIYLT